MNSSDRVRRSDSSTTLIVAQLFAGREQRLDDQLEDQAEPSLTQVGLDVAAHWSSKRTVSNRASSSPARRHDDMALGFALGFDIPADLHRETRR